MLEHIAIYITSLFCCLHQSMLFNLHKVKYLYIITIFSFCFSFVFKICKLMSVMVKHLPFDTYLLSSYLQKQLFLFFHILYTYFNSPAGFSFDSFYICIFFPIGLEMCNFVMSSQCTVSGLIRSAQ